QDVVDAELDRQVGGLRGGFRLLDGARRDVGPDDLESALREVHRMRRRPGAQVQDAFSLEAVLGQSPFKVFVEVRRVPREALDIGGRVEPFPPGGWLRHDGATHPSTISLCPAWPGLPSAVSSRTPATGARSRPWFQLEPRGRQARRAALRE